MDYEISDDTARLDIDVIHGFLAQSYWSPGIPRAVVERAIAGSLCFGIHLGAAQVGFARVITDRATFAYLADVFVLPETPRTRTVEAIARARRLASDLQGLRRFALVTRDGHGLYARFGFKALAQPDRWMEIVDPGIYQRGGANR